MEDLLDKPVSYLLGEEQAQLIFEKAQAERERNVDPHLRSLSHTPVNIRVEGEEKTFDAILHRSEQGFYLLELEPHDLFDDYPLEGPYQLTKNAILQMQQAGNLSNLYNIVVSEVAQLTGFDRVMVYQFDEEYHGKVVAEYLREGTFDVSYKGLNFPNTDIPANARRLYMKNWLRLIPDRDYEAVKIGPFMKWQQDEPLDLSLSVLRSVSPYHLEYLEVMGVQSTMSISLFENDRLWGLIACHGQSTNFIPYTLRMACEFIGQSLSLMMAQKQSLNTEKRLRLLDRISRKLSIDLYHPSDLTTGLEKQQEEIGKLMRCHGFAIVDHLNLLSGTTPIRQQVDDLCRWLDEQLKNTSQGYYASSQLSKVYEAAREYEEISSGILAIPIEHPQPGYLIWFRQPVSRTVNWAGKPEKREVRDARGIRYSPRKSFAVWQEKQKGHSKGWTPADIQIAKEFRTVFYELQSSLYRQLEKENELLEKKIRERTQELSLANDMLREAIDRRFVSEEELLQSLSSLKTANEDLERFAYVTSHDLREPLRVISNFSQLLDKRYADQLDQKGRKYIHFIKEGTQRMQNLIEDLLRYSRVQKKSHVVKDVSMDNVVRETIRLLELQLEESGGSVEVSTPMPKVRADRSLLMQLMQNLIGNAIKYCHPDRPPRINVGAEEENEFYYRFWVRDNGIGIDEKDQESIFDMFVRLFTTEEYEGTGIGLAICQRIVHNFGGSIYVSSEVDKGSVFYFTLPKATEQTSA
jgi:chemotaxis family two-component system sensor kinase Cph1